MNTPTTRIEIVWTADDVLSHFPEMKPYQVGKTLDLMFSEYDASGEWDTLDYWANNVLDDETENEQEAEKIEYRNEQNDTPSITEDI